MGRDGANGLMGGRDVFSQVGEKVFFGRGKKNSQIGNGRDKKIRKGQAKQVVHFKLILFLLF